MTRAREAARRLPPEIREFLASQGLEGLLRAAAGSCREPAQTLAMHRPGDGGHIGHSAPAPALESPRDDELGHRRQHAGGVPQPSQ